MIRKLFNRIKVFVNPPKTGGVYYGNPTRFVTAKPVEYVLHGLKDRHGKTILEPIPSNYGYRITIESDAMPTYYRCTAEVLCKSVDPLYITDNNMGQWMKRSQPRKILKSLFKDLLKSGILVKN